MDETEYYSLVRRIVDGGKGYEAISDISRMLERKDEERMIAFAESKAERKMIQAICKSNQSYKSKVEVIALQLEDA